jgi:cytochrome c551/c552
VGVKEILYSIICLCVASCSNNLQVSEPVPEKTATIAIDGEKLYKSKCAQCHKCNEDVSGPALNNTIQNWPDKKIFYAFVRNSQEVIKTNAYARALYKKWLNTKMPDFPGLTDKEIDAIMNWCGKQMQ